MKGVALHLDRGDRIGIRPIAYLGDEWQGYLAVLRAVGAKYEPATKSNSAPLDRAPEIVRAFEAAGFAVHIGDDLRARVAHTADELAATVSEADARLEAIEADLAARGMRLYPFQREGVRWLTTRRTALLADEMGLGKTVQALIAIPHGAPVVVICPAAVKGVWKAEAKRWRPELKPYVCAGRGSFAAPGPGEIAIVNYDILPEEPGLHPGTVVVADEAHALKNGRAARTKRFRALRDAALPNGGAIWLLTGTPLLNRPPELWSVLEAADLARDAFGSWTQFKRVFGGKSGHWGGVEWGTPTEAAPDLLRRVSLCRKRADVLPDLPTKSWRDVRVEDLDRETREICDEVVERLRAKGIDLETATEDQIAAIGHAGFSELSAARAALARAKVPALLGLVEEHEEGEDPLVVFSYHRAPVDVLGEREGWATITGDVSPEKRTEIVARFQRGELRGVAATIQAAGVGLTLTRAHQVLFVDLAWTPALNAQAEDRVCRIGQDRGVVVTTLVADHPLDERVTELLTRKQRIISASVDASARTGDVADQSIDRLRELASRPTAAPDLSGNDGGPQRKPRRPARDHRESWAASALLRLAAMDPDHAMKENGIGFSKLDNAFGHSLADQLSRSGQLTDGQWNAAIRLAMRYPRQVGRPEPVAEENR